MSTVEITRKDEGTVLAEERTDLALQRTVIAGERTLMAWIRTALSMIGFGFSIYNFFRYLPEEIANGTARRPQAPRNLGMSLIALGTVSLIAAAWQHRHFLRAIGASRESAYMVHSLCSCNCCGVDWSDRVLRGPAAQQPVLIGNRNLKNKKGARPGSALHPA